MVVGELHVLIEVLLPLCILLTCLQPFAESPAALRFRTLLQDIMTPFNVEIYLPQHLPVKGNIWEKKKNIFISENSSSSFSKLRFILCLLSFAKSWPGFTFLLTNLLFSFLAVCCHQTGVIPGCSQLHWGHLNFKTLHVGVSWFFLLHQVHKTHFKSFFIAKDYMGSL